MGIRIRLSTSVANVTESEVELSNGDHIKDALCIWTTGLIGPDLTRNLEIEKKQKGRICVDKTLRFKENCFAAGDVACFETGVICSRMSVQFSIEQGSLAAENAIAFLKGKSLSSYIPFDPGYMIPMANGNSCGEAFGFRIKGNLATFLHYLLSAYRSYGIVNRFQTLRGMLKLSK
jgi:NADH dehydrogenase FAD-containing subunit